MPVACYGPDGKALHRAFGTVTDAVRAFAADAALETITAEAIVKAADSRTVLGGFRWACVPDGAPPPPDVGQTVTRTQAGQRNRGCVCAMDAGGARVARVYATVGAAAAELGVTPAAISIAVRNGGCCKGHKMVPWDAAPDGARTEYLAAGNTLPDRRAARPDGGGGAVVGTHAPTGAVVRFADAQKAARAFNTKADRILGSIATGKACAGYTWAHGPA